MRQTIDHQTYKHTKNTFCLSPLSRALLLHASTSPIVLSRQNPSISSFADHLCPLLPNSLHRPYVPVYIEDIVTVPTARQMSGDQTGLLIYFLTFPPKSIFYDTETKHIHVLSYSPYIYKRILCNIKAGFKLIDIIKKCVKF